MSVQQRGQQNGYWQIGNQVKEKIEMIDNSDLLRGIACCESFLEGYEAQKACDDTSDTCWKAEPYFKWWMVDFETVCYVDHLRLILGHNGEYYHYHVECSTDRINWTLLTEKKDDKVATAEGDMVLVHNLARFIRITVSFCSNSSVVTIQNVSAFGYRLNEYTDRIDITTGRVKAVTAAMIAGFDIIDDMEVDSSWRDSVVKTDISGGRICFENIDFGEGRFDQLRFCLGLPVKDKALFIDIEFRLDGVRGKKVGRLHLCRQYTPFTEIAAELLMPNGERIRGTHSLFIIVTHIDSPQSVMLYWMRLDEHPRLSGRVTDYSENLIEDDTPYSIFFGDMHCHTGLTDGFGTAEHAYEYARNVAKMDFLGITEHSNCLDEMFDCNRSFKWRDLKAASEKATEDGKFVGLYGSETTWYNQFGHMNIYCADFYINSYEFRYDDAQTYYRKLKEFPGLISQWNHPWSCGSRHLDLFEPYDEELDRITYTIELNNIELTKEDVLKYYIIALDKGWHLSPVGNQDNHKEDWGTQNGIRTGIIARRLTVADIFDAMKNRRTYFTGTPGFRVMFYLNGEIQGSIIDDADNLVVKVSASCDDLHKIATVEVYGEHGRVLDTIECDDYIIDLSYRIKEKQRYYFLKLIRDDEQIAVTAPIWIKK